MKENQESQQAAKQYVGRRKLELMLDCSAPTIWRMIADGRLPQPKQFGGTCRRWDLGEVNASLARINADQRT
jgi:predicted DNA-binding transcriptional regulator AlpA